MPDYMTTISAVAEVYDGPHATPKKIQYGPYFLSISSLEKGALDLTKSARVNEEDFVKWTKRITPQAGDILFSYETRLGDAALMPPKIKACLGRRMGLLRPKTKKVIPDYLLYAYLSPKFQKTIRAKTIHGATVDRIALKELPDFPIRIPPKDEQEKVVTILKSLGDKIELNLQINQTLEQIAQAIFKSWFVDFEPVKAKIEAKQNGQDPERAAIRALSGKTDEKLNQLPVDQLSQLTTTAALFPDELVDSELGSIPKRWERVPFGNVVEILDSKRVPLSKQQREERKGSYPYYGAASIMDYVDDYLFDGTYVLMAEDGSVMNGSGYPTIQYVWGKFWVNNHAHILKGLGSVTDENILLFLKNTIIAPYITGAVQLKINQKNMKMIPFLEASEALHQYFGETIRPLFEGIKKHSDEILSLTQLRDTLLPKLLSGAISADTAQAKVREAV